MPEPERSAPASEAGHSVGWCVWGPVLGPGLAVRPVPWSDPAVSQDGLG